MATVLHRTTKQLVKSAHTPNYPSNLWIHNPDLSAVEDVDRVFWVIEDDSVREMTATEKDANHLAQHKSEKYVTFDVKTDALIAQGFIYAESSFSLSDQAQNRIMGSHQARDDAAFVYPLKWNTLDDLDVLEIADSATLHAFYLTALGTYRAHVDSGTALKDQVRAATTIAGVDAVVDSR